ncbi:MAG: DUF4382 domain-containing protein [Bacteroidota bacterium]
MKARILLIFLLGLGLLAGNSCSKEESPSTLLKISLTDAPAEYDEVNVDIQQLTVLTERGWKTLSTRANIYNLTILSGTDVLLASGRVPEGHISKIRIVFGHRNSLVINETVHPLELALPSEDGLIIDLDDHALAAGTRMNLILDFDAGESVIPPVLSGTNYVLKPKIRVIAVGHREGNIKGTIDPLQARPYIKAESRTGSYSTYAGPSGFFTLRALPSGMYKVNFYPKPPYAPRTLDSVIVKEGQTTDIGKMHFYYRGRETQ